MARTLLEKYEQIFAADPRSRIFVELAKAHVERGDHARAIEVCRQGLEHHPASILGRVVWGRALLERGETAAALEQLGAATRLDPDGPYAFNLVGEVLLAKGLLADALPVLSRAAQLQPADARIRGWLDDTRRRLRDAPGAAAPVNGAAAPEPTIAPSAADPAEGLADEAERGRPTAAANTVVEAASSTDGLAEANAASAESTAETTAGVAPAHASEPALQLEAASAPGDERELREPAAPGGGEVLALEDLGPDVTPGDDGPAPEPDAAAPRMDAQPHGAPLDLDGDPPGLSLEVEPAVRLASAPTTPPPIPLPSAADTPGSLLSLIPGGPAPRNGAARNGSGATRAAPGAAKAPATPSKAEAARIAAEFEQEMRARLLAVPEPPPSALKRHRKAVLVAAAVLALVGAAAVYLVVDARNAARLAVGAAARARAGLARDTAGSLGEAARLLREARRRSRSEPELASLAAAVAAVRASEHGDEEARALASGLVEDGIAGDGAMAARFLLATEPAARAAAEEAILAAPPSSEPLVQVLAGRILLGRGQREGGQKRLELAAHASPPLLRALSDLGDDALAAGDPERALELHAAALAAHPTHPRAVVGAAEARLELGQDLEGSKKELAAVEADPGSAPPRDLRERFALVTARVQAATGDAAGAADRLAQATRELGDSPALAAAAAEVQLSARAWEQAEAAARRAVQLAPKDVAARVLLARALIGRGLPVAALGATDGLDGRAVRIQRAIARLRLGQPVAARAELERTARDGRMPAEAAVWYALSEVGSGRPERARTILERLLATRSPPRLTQLALGRALEAEGKADEAERAYRTAAERDPSAPEPQLALGSLLLAGDRAEDALPFLSRAVALDPADTEARRALGAASLAAGKPAEARAELDAVLLARPKDPDALRLLSAAWLAEDQPSEARLAAQRGLAAAPRHPALLLAGARAALATGARGEAKALAVRALKLSPRGPNGAEARKILALAVKR